MPEITAERQALYDELHALVEKFVALDNRDDTDGIRVMATAHVLLVGGEEFDPETGNTGGRVVLLPAGGRQASWKTSGLINMAKAFLEVDHYCGAEDEA